MNKSKVLIKPARSILGFLLLLLIVSPVMAIPVTFDWGSFEATGSTAFGVYDDDNATILQTGDLVQFIWAGPNEAIDAPLADGSPGGDDQILHTSTIQNNSGPPPLQNRGYIFLSTYSYDTEDPQADGMVYIRAWNDPSPGSATAYGDSTTGILTSGGAYNASRWFTNVSLDPSNTPPTADAGPDQTVTDSDLNGSEDVTLDGSGSTDTDGTIVSYVWNEGGNQIATGTIPTVNFAVGSHTVTLEVTDDDGATNTDTMTITVNAGNQPPTADAGPDQTVTDSDLSGSEDVTLDGSGSSDTDGTIVSYVWSEDGSQIATGATPTVNFALGSHTVTLEVTDDDGATGTNTVSITVNASNQPPTADAGPDQTITDSDLNGSEDVTLDGSGSSDTDGTIVSYVWSEDGSQIATGATPTVNFALGSHTVTLEVSDDDGATDTDAVTITVNAGNQPPTANAGPDQTVTDSDLNGSEDVTLDGSGSSDTDGTIVSYVWSENGNQIATGATPTVNFAVGSHIVTLEVTDDDGATETDAVTITVNAGNQPPTTDDYFLYLPLVIK